MGVAVSSEVHHLYFEDHRGTIRVVLVGFSGAGLRARQPIQLLSPQVRVIERGPARVP